MSSTLSDLDKETQEKVKASIKKRVLSLFDPGVNSYVITNEGIASPVSSTVYSVKLTAKKIEWTEKRGDVRIQMNYDLESGDLIRNGVTQPIDVFEKFLSKLNQASKDMNENRAATYLS